MKILCPETLGPLPTKHNGIVCQKHSVPDRQNTYENIQKRGLLRSLTA